MGERHVHGGHPNLVAEEVALDVEGTLQTIDLFRRRGEPERDRRELDVVAGDRSGLDLDDAGRMGKDELDRPLRLRTPVPHLRMERPLIVHRPRSLRVREERLADVREPDLLAVAERLDRGVLAAALADPCSEQESERFDLGMERGCHRPNVPRAGASPTTERTARSSFMSPVPRLVAWMP